MLLASLVFVCLWFVLFFLLDGIAFGSACLKFVLRACFVFACLFVFSGCDMNMCLLLMFPFECAFAI